MTKPERLPLWPKGIEGQGRRASTILLAGPGPTALELASGAFSLQVVLFILLALATPSILAPAVGLRNSGLNIIENPSFQHGLQDWNTYFLDGPPGSTITSNSTRSVTGHYSARIDVSTGRVFGSVDLYQLLPPNTLFANMTQSRDGLSFWFYIEPKFTNFTLLLVNVKAASTIEMDYIFPNPSLGVGFLSTTNGGEGGRAVKQIILPAPAFGQWNHFSRNIVQDWQAPLKITNSTGTFMLPGFGLNESLYRTQFEAFVYQDVGTGQNYSETVWIDDVALLRQMTSQ